MRSSPGHRIHQPKEPSMMKAERQELILKRVADSGRVVVTDLAKEMGVTETTLR